MSIFETDLCRDLKEKRVIAVAGAGVSILATGNHPVACWTGLLENGVRRCRAVDRSRDEGWERRKVEDINCPWLGDVLATASIIRHVLRSRPGEYRSWLRDTVGSLTAADPEILASIARLGTPIATTNFDGLFDRYLTNHRPITWKDSGAMLRALRGDDHRSILHLHGYWDDEDSVVLGFQDYAEILGHAEAQARQQLLAGRWTLLFIGFGAGLGDPNFRTLIRWISGFFGEADYFHYQLVRECDLDRVQAQHPPDAHMRLIPYGKEYSELPRYLSRLAQGAGLPAFKTHRETAAGQSSPNPAREPLVQPVTLEEIIRYGKHGFSFDTKSLRGFQKEQERPWIQNYIKDTDED